jgi:C1A family cysteine protease
MKMHRVGLFSILLVILIATQTWAAPGDVEAIQKAIQSQKAHWQTGSTPYTDYTLEQKKAMLGALLPPNPEIRKNLPLFPYQVAQVDQEVDWRNRNGHNWVTPIRDQGQCGSCWAFGCVAALESAMLISANAPNYMIDLSEQYLVSCSPGSCNGWYAEGTLDFMQNQGVTDEVCMPYGATDYIPCSARCSDYLFRLSRVASWGAAPNVAAMKNALNVGPISATFEVFNDFYSYGNGVYQHVSGPSVGWHLICIVGYSDAQNAWICKNSWGPSWGMSGYFMIRMNYNECHIEEGCDWLLPAQAQYPNISVGTVAVQDESGGDGDGVLNPGETTNLAIALQNTPLTTPANNLTARLATEDPRVTILDEDGAYPNLQPGQTVNNTDPFTIRMAPGCALGPIEFTLFVYANDTATIPYYVERGFTISVTLNQPGYPLAGSEMDGAPAVYDLNGDGALDIITGDFNGYLKAVNGQGQSLPGFPYHIQGFIKSSPALADLDGDGNVEIVFTGWSGFLYILNTSGALETPPINLGFFASATPTLGDLDGDGTLEIMVGSWNGKMYAFHYDGTPVVGFPFTAGTNQCITDGALLLDVNNDNLPEILFGSINHKLYAVSGSGQELWHFDLGDVPAGAPVAAQLQSSSGISIIVPDAGGQVHYLNVNGQQERSANLGATCKCSPSIADLDRDGNLEIALNDQMGGIHMLDAQGEEIPGFPVLVGSGIWASSSFADIDNDGWLDLVVADLGGSVHVIKHDGDKLNPFPVTMESGTRSTATIANVDQDTYLEIILGSYTGLVALDSKLNAGVSGGWNMYPGNLRRTGNYTDGLYRGVPPPGTGSEIPKTYALLPARPNPFNPVTVISFQLPHTSHLNLSVFDVSGRMVTTLLDGSITAGTHEVTFNGSDLASGLYFVRMKAEGYNQTMKVLLVK